MNYYKKLSQMACITEIHAKEIIDTIYYKFNGDIDDIFDILVEAIQKSSITISDLFDACMEVKRVFPEHRDLLGIVKIFTDFSNRGFNTAEASKALRKKLDKINKVKTTPSECAYALYQLCKPEKPNKMKPPETIKVRALKTHKWYKTGEIYEVLNHVSFGWGFGDEHNVPCFEQGDGVMGIRCDDCEILNRESVNNVELIPVPGNIRFTHENGIISEDGKYALIKASNKSAYAIIVNYTETAKNAYLQKIDFKDIKAGDIICDNISNKDHLNRYNIVINNKEWRYLDDENTPIYLNSLFLNEDVDYYKVVFK